MPEHKAAGNVNQRVLCCPWMSHILAGIRIGGTGMPLQPLKAMAVVRLLPSPAPAPAPRCKPMCLNQYSPPENNLSALSIMVPRAAHYLQAPGKETPIFGQFHASQIHSLPPQVSDLPRFSACKFKATVFSCHLIFYSYLQGFIRNITAWKESIYD